MPVGDVTMGIGDMTAEAMADITEGDGNQYNIIEGAAGPFFASSL